MKCIVMIRKAVFGIIWWCMALNLGYLFIASIFSTSCLGSVENMSAADAGTLLVNSEHTFYIRDHWWGHLIVFVVFTAIVSLYHKAFGITGREKKHNRDTKQSALVLSIAFVLMLLIITLCDFYPKTDQKHIMELAGEFLHHNYSSLNSGEYLDKFPQQYGILFFYMALSRIFGCNNYIAFEIVNAVLIALTYWVFSGTASKLIPDLPAINTAIWSIIFIPYLFYSLLVYGTVVGLFLSCCSIALICRYVENNHLVFLIASALFIAIAVVLKSNYSIFFIAEAIYLLFLPRSSKKILHGISWCACTILVLVSITAGIHQYIKVVNDGILPSGVPKVAWIAMGLQDGKNAPGWYNGFNTAVYENSNYDTGVAEETSRKSIQKSLRNFSINKTDFITFMAKKIQSQWNNPTFQVLWELEGEAGHMDWLVTGRGRFFFTEYCNFILSFVYGFALYYWLTETKTKNWSEILCPLFFLGGFTFHLFWEAQCLYAMPYMIMLLPMSGKGIQRYSQKLTQRRNYLHMGTICVTVAMVVLISYTKPFQKIFARNDDDHLFNTYSQNIVNSDKMCFPQSVRNSK